MQLDGYLLYPDHVMASVQAVGFAIMAEVERQPDPLVEYPSRRCYLLGQRR